MRHQVEGSEAEELVHNDELQPRVDTSTNKPSPLALVFALDNLWLLANGNEKKKGTNQSINQAIMGP